jgi:hypothetical protein
MSVNATTEHGRRPELESWPDLTVVHEVSELRLNSGAPRLRAWRLDRRFGRRPKRITLIYLRRSWPVYSRARDPKEGEEPAHEALVSREMFDKANLTAIKRDNVTKARNGHDDYRQHTYVFRSFLRCVLCGLRMHGNVRRGRNGAY